MQVLKCINLWKVLQKDKGVLFIRKMVNYSVEDGYNKYLLFNKITTRLLFFGGVAQLVRAGES